MTAASRVVLGEALREAYLRWLVQLAVGDKVRVRLPWQDKKVRGGRVVPGKVVEANVSTRGLLVEHKNGHGDLTTEFFYYASGASGPYAYLEPVDRGTVYDPEFGQRLEDSARL